MKTDPSPAFMKQFTSKDSAAPKKGGTNNFKKKKKAGKESPLLAAFGK